MSRPRVIKDNNGVAIVEGTPASSLIKEADKFFAIKPPERMAGESVSQPRKIDTRAINTKSPIQRRPQSERTDEERRANLEAFDRLSEERKREMTINTRSPFGIKDVMDQALVSRPAPGSTIPLGPDDRPIGDPIKPKIVPGLNDAPVEVWPWGREDDPNYEKKKKEYFDNIDKSAPRDSLPRDTVYRDLEDSPMRPAPRPSRRNEAKDKGESRRERFFQRVRSRKEARRSEKEREATKGRFITTLGR